MMALCGRAAGNGIFPFPAAVCFRNEPPPTFSAGRRDQPARLLLHQVDMHPYSLKLSGQVHHRLQQCGRIRDRSSAVPQATVSLGRPPVSCCGAFVLPTDQALGVDAQPFGPGLPVLRAACRSLHDDQLADCLLAHRDPGGP
jgi:hypothetical protein